MDSTGSKSGGGDGEDEQEESSSSTYQVEDALASFREQWQQELKITPKRNVTQSAIKEPNTEELSNEKKAKQLFMKGIEYEKNGDLYDAIRFYKTAVQLVPDIEFRLYESTKPKAREKLEKDEANQRLDNNGVDMNKKDDNDNDDEDGDHDDDDGDDIDLLTKLSRIVNRNQCVCFPRFEQSTVHISALPMEIFFYILRWVVSSDLDLRSLEKFSAVCRGFFLAARDPEIWRLACAKVWGVNCGNFAPKYSSWRHMFVERPRLRFNGCYISKISYVRHGENSFQDKFYRPWHLIEYFRYLRFFPEGQVLMLTSTEDAQICVNNLKHRNPKQRSIMIGHYRLTDNSVIIFMKKEANKPVINTYRKKRRDEVVHDSGEQTFHLKFEIQHHHKKPNCLLSWIQYEIYTMYKNGQQGTSSLNACVKYPPFRFSRVRSYTQESEAPLQ